MKVSIYMRKLLIIIAIINVWPAFAEGGFYAGIGFGYANIANTAQNNFTFNNGSSGTQNGPAPASTLYGGYDFNRYIGIQADYNVAYSAQIPGSSYSVYQQLIGASVLLHLPFGLFSNALSGFSIFVKGGLDYSVFDFGNVSSTCSTCVNPPGTAYAVVPVYGLGAEYGFGNVGIRGEWNYNSNVMAPNFGSNQVQASSNMYLLSVLYHF